MFQCYASAAKPHFRRKYFKIQNVLRHKRNHKRVWRVLTLVWVMHSLKYLRRQFGCEVSSEVILRRDQTRGVVDLDLQVGKRVQERRVGHRDFIWNIVEGIHRATIHGRRICQVRRSCQEISLKDLVKERDRESEGGKINGRKYNINSPERKSCLRQKGNMKGKARYFISSTHGCSTGQMLGNVVDQWAGIRETRAGRAADKVSVSVWCIAVYRGMTWIKD